MKKKKWGWVLIATFALVTSASAQSQFETTFEAGIGYTRPGIGQFDMVTLLLQGDGYLFEAGIGLGANAGLDNEDRISALFRAATRGIRVGNNLLHVGGEFSLHTNSTRDNGESDTLLSLSVLVGVSHPISEHLNFEVNLFPANFKFGGDETTALIPTAQLGAHIMF